MNPRDSYTKASAKPGKGNGDDDLAFQLIDGNGTFNDVGLKDFARNVNLHQCGCSYAVVAVMGPQCSGKSTLLNHLFHTNFKMMDNSYGRAQTTKGIWLARSPDIQPLTLVMDMEGTDGSERGEDETAFEKQSALFALTLADVVLINIWCQDIGREHAANKPLLRVVFQQAMIQFCNKPRKTTLMFVVRDKTKSPENVLEAKLKEDIEKIWASILTPPGSSNLQLRNFFKVEVVFLPNYEEKEEDFKLKVKNFKQRFVHSTAPGGLANAGDQKNPASVFSMMAQNIWKDIMEDKDLDIPAHKVMVATVHCEEINNELYNSFQMNEDWCNLHKDAQFGFVPDFQKIVNSILNTCVSKYDAETLYFDDEVTNAKREELLHQLLQFVEPVYQAMVNRLRLEHLKKFMEAFDKDSDEHSRFSTVADRIQYCLLEFDKDCSAIRVDRAKWDTVKAKAKLQNDMNSYTCTKHEDKLAYKIRRLYEPKLEQELSDSVGYILCEKTDPTWSKIRERFKSVKESTLSQFHSTLSEFWVDEENMKEKIERIEKYAKLVVELKAREESNRAKIHMFNKFVKLLMYGYISWLRDWKNDNEIDRAASYAVYTPVKLLAGLAAIRLEDGDTDAALLVYRDQKVLEDLDSPSWEHVPPSRTLITPIMFKMLWEAFKVEVKDVVNNDRELVQPLHHLWLEYLNKFMEAFDKKSDEQKLIFENQICISCYKPEKGLEPKCFKPDIEKALYENEIIIEPVRKSSEKKSESKGKSPSVTAVERGSAIASELTDPNGSFSNQAVNYGNMIDRTLLYPFDVEHHKQLTLAQRGHFMETIGLQLLSMMRIQNLECAHLLSKVETSAKAKSEKETRITKLCELEASNAEPKANKVESVDEENVMRAKLAKTKDTVVELGRKKEVLSREKADAIKRFKSYWEVLEFGFWNGVNQAAYQAKLQYPGFEVDETKLCKFKALHKGQLMDPGEVPEEDSDE